ncbi:sigma-70 family RNA polymerase sigma factor [Diaphorobacter caeni]|uniref:sigma-70 family RNA polymerase sigma factor n=1 Tax=Diaphorobacter caeni TaxID=2784387 RepID=UPI00188FB6E3|nr:sigma-70 family RNA polymerase sigma factor [Diaphorobacter caeni]MBF5005690.1 sigma-70 family RNA polymerase sigma factor [Diaphorobacter caeni]
MGDGTSHRALDEKSLPPLLGERLDDRIKSASHSLNPFFRMAIVAGVVDAVKLHIARGDNVNASDNFGLTPLMLAARADKPSICALLLAAGADPTLVDRSGRTARSYISTKSSAIQQLLTSSCFDDSVENPLSPEHEGAIGSPPKSGSEASFVDAGLGTELDEMKWEPDDTPSEVQPDPTLTIVAGRIQHAISTHAPVETGEHWLEGPTSLPDSPAPKTTADQVDLRDLLKTAIRSGFAKNEQLIALSRRIKCSDADFALSVLKSAMAELQVEVLDSNPIGNALTNSIEHSEASELCRETVDESEQLNEACYWVESTISGRWTPSLMFLKEAQAFRLLTAEQEIQLGQSMEAAIQTSLEALAEWHRGISTTIDFGRLVLSGARPLSSVSQDSENDPPDSYEKNTDDNADSSDMRDHNEDFDGLGPCEQRYPRFESALERLATTADEISSRDGARLAAVEQLSLTRTFLLELHAAHQNDPSNEYAVFDTAIRSYLQARDHLVSANLRLAQHLSRKFIHSGEPIDDLTQAGNLGLLKAADKYDWRKGFKFSTYASWWIRQSVSRHIADSGRTIRIPVHIHEKLRLYSRERLSFELQTGRAPTRAELALRLKSTPKLIDLLQSLTWEMHSIEDVPLDNVDVLRLEESDLEHPEGRLAANQLKSIVDEMLASHKRMHANVVRLRYGIGVPSNFTLEEIGSRHEVTRERIRQIEQKVMSTFRRKVALQALSRKLYGRPLRGLAHSDPEFTEPAN